MTMENGDGRPLDEEEAGGEDPQGWYFDLPGGAWERQEEKNRTLRQRVLGNISEDAEKAKSDPFARRVPEPEPPAKGGLFGFGRKKKQQPEPPHESAGGTWAINRTGPPSEEDPNSGTADEADDWSTEIPLRLEHQPDLVLRRHAEPEQREPWAAPDAGWSIGASDDDDSPAGDGEQDFRERMQFWARGGQAEGEPQADEPNAETDDREPDQWVPEVAETSFAVSADAPADAFPVATEDEESEQAGDPDAAFLARMRSWATAPAMDDADDDGDGAPAPRNDVLQLRPRAVQPGEHGPDREFEPGGWAGPSSTNESAAENSGPAGGGAEPTEPADMLESMRQWAERAKEAEHRHFALQHHTPDEDAVAETPVIPLRPRNHGDHPGEQPPTDEGVAPRCPRSPGRSRSSSGRAPNRNRIPGQAIRTRNRPGGTNSLA